MIRLRAAVSRSAPRTAVIAMWMGTPLWVVLGCGPSIPPIEAPPEEPPVYETTTHSGDRAQAVESEPDEEPEEAPIALGDSEGQMLVQVRASGVTVGGDHLTDAQLTERLTTMVPKPSVLLQAVGETAYARVVQVMDLARAAGATQMAIVSEEGGEATGVTGLSSALRASHQRCRDTGREGGHDMDAYRLISTMEEQNRSRLVYEADTGPRLRCLVPTAGTVSVVAEHAD